MPKIIFVQPDGSRQALIAKNGDSVMDCAVDHAVAHIYAQCGGGCTCSTCHAVIDAQWIAKVGAPVGDEADILDYVPERQPGSRLTCQIPVTGDLDGLVVHLVEPLPNPD